MEIGRSHDAGGSYFTEDEYKMEWNLELTLNTTASRFEQWLRQYVPSSIPNYVDNRECKPTLYIESPIIIYKEEDKFVKILGSPYLKEDSQGLRLYDIRLTVGRLDSLEEGVESELSIPLLKIFETIDGTTTVLIRLNQFDLYKYFKDLTKEIARLWPETKREISRLEAIDCLEMDNILFEFVIEAEPQEFIEWSHTELGELYPGVFTHKIGDHETLTHTSGDYFPPDNYNSTWEYVIYAHDTEFLEDETTREVKAYKSFSGAIARIEMHHIVNSRYHVKCLCGSYHPQILKWFQDFKERIILVYEPQTIKKNETQELEYKHSSREKFEMQQLQQEEMKPWKIIPDNYWDRIAVEMWCQGHTNKEIAQRVYVQPKTVTNKISSLRRMYPQANIPTDEERRKSMIRGDSR